MASLMDYYGGEAYPYQECQRGYSNLSNVPSAHPKSGLESNS